MRLLHAEWMDGRERGRFHEAHAAGAVLLDTDRIEDGYPTWRLRPVDELAHLLGSLGIARDDEVVVCGSDLAAACRVWWLLQWLGVERVSVLPDCTDRGASEPGTSCTFVPELRPAWLATEADVFATLEGRSDACLVDVRSAAEYRGEVSGYGYLQRAGRIPGAVLADIAPLTALLGRDDIAGVSEYWRTCGVDLQRRDGVIFYCGSGWRSSVACLAAARLGVHARNYSNGWCGWSTHYVRDANALHVVAGATPGWRQDDTGRPVARG